MQDLYLKDREILNIFPQLPTALLPTRIQFAKEQIQSLKDRLGRPLTAEAILFFSTVEHLIEYRQKEYDIS